MSTQTAGAINGAPRLVRLLALAHAVLYGLGVTIGAGIYATPLAPPTAPPPRAGARDTGKPRTHCAARMRRCGCFRVVPAKAGTHNSVVVMWESIGSLRQRCTQP